MRKKILLFGGSGMLGQELAHCFSSDAYEIISPSRDKTDISSQENVFRLVQSTMPDIILNAAVLVNVDACEENPEKAYSVNTLGPLFIADALRTLNLKNTIFVQFSSSDIFGSDFSANPREDNEAFPINVYGRSKYYGERCVNGILGEKGFASYIIRSSWIFSEFKKTFVDVIAEHVLRPTGVFTTAEDQRGIPTWGKDIAENAKTLIEKKYQYGVYHFVPDACSVDATRFEIAREIAEILGRNDVERLFSKAPRTRILKAPRPASSAIITTRFPKLPNWKESLRTFMEERYLKTRA